MTSALVPTGPRDVRDAKRLAELEHIIEAGLTSFVAVGEALLEVRGSKLYRLNHETFEAYCKSRWGFSRQHAHRLMEGAEVVAVLSPMGDIPTTERQARELVPVLKDHGPEVAAAVMAEASANGRPTAATVRAAARPRLDAAPDPYFATRTVRAVVDEPTEPAFRVIAQAFERDIRRLREGYQSHLGDERFAARFGAVLAAIAAALGEEG